MILNSHKNNPGNKRFKSKIGKYRNYIGKQR
jgi:hypothetical protein